MMVFLIGIQYLNFKGLRHDLFFSSKNENSLIYVGYVWNVRCCFTFKHQVMFIVGFEAANSGLKFGFIFVISGRFNSSINCVFCVFRE